MSFSTSAVDPFVVTESSSNPIGGYRSTNTKTLRTPVIAAGESTGVFVIAGQSTCANSLDGSYTPTNGSKIDNFNIYDGGTYVAADPQLGCTIDTVGGVGNLFFRMADKLITTSVFARVIIVPIGVGGSQISEWAPGGAHNKRLIISAQRLAAVGLPITAFLWMQGETDAALGTVQATYQTALGNVIGTPRALGYNAPWLVGQCTYNSGNTSSAVRAAQAAVVNGTTIYAGADTDTLTGTSVNRQADNTHFKVAGGDAAAALWRTAVDAVF